MSAGVYYPPDFDASKLMPVKALKPKGPQMMNIRMMFPFTMVCDTCKEYNYTGTKFTAKTEQIKGESFLGLKVYRFYGRCRHCWSEFTFKTDPKNSDYTMESGGKRTYEAWKDADAMETQMKQEKEKEAEQDQMKALEQKAVDVQSEMQRLEDLDAIRTLNKRLGNRDDSIQNALDYLFKQSEAEEAQQEKLPQGDLDELKGFQQAQEEQKRKLLDDEVEGVSRPDSKADLAGFGDSASSQDKDSSAIPKAGSAILAAVAERASAQKAKAKPKFTVKRKEPEPSADGAESSATKRVCRDGADSAAPAEAAKSTPSTGGGLVGAYDSDSS